MPHTTHWCAPWPVHAAVAEPLAAVGRGGWGSSLGVAPGAKIQVQLPLLTETSPLLLANRFLCFLTLHALSVAGALVAAGAGHAAGWADRTLTGDSALFHTWGLERAAVLPRATC